VPLHIHQHDEFGKVETQPNVMHIPLSQSVKHGIQWSMCVAVDSRLCFLMVLSEGISKSSGSSLSSETPDVSNPQDADAVLFAVPDLLCSSRSCWEHQNCHAHCPFPLPLLHNPNQHPFGHYLGRGQAVWIPAQRPLAGIKR